MVRKKNKIYKKSQKRELIGLVKAKTKTEAVLRDLGKFKLAVENVYDHIIITDKRGIILYANKSVERITGFSKKEVINKRAGDKSLWGGLMPKEFYQKMWKTISQDKKTFTGEITNHRKNGEKYVAFSTISPIMNKKGEVQFFVGIERDITKEKEIDKAKSEFVSLASHQLRTPLATINWYTEMLLSEEIGKINKSQREYLQEIYSGNQRMINLVNALLNISRIDLGTLAIKSKPTSILDIANSVIKELGPLAAIKNIKINKKFPVKLPKILLDESLIRIVFYNLLTNAVKYSPAKEKVVMTISKKAKEIIITVADHGYGIPINQQDKIFTKLFRANNIKAKETDGTGLGLYIAKSIIEQAQGKIWFKSIENRGTTFYLTIPISGMKQKDGNRGLSIVK